MLCMANEINYSTYWLGVSYNVSRRVNSHTLSAQPLSENKRFAFRLGSSQTTKVGDAFDVAIASLNTIKAQHTFCDIYRDLLEGVE